MRDGGFVPGLVSRFAAAECLEIPDIDVITRDVWAFDPEHVIGPGNREIRRFRE